MGWDVFWFPAGLLVSQSVVMGSSWVFLDLGSWVCWDSRSF